MTEKRLALLEQLLGEQEDEAIALRFAFMTLARALDEQGVLPLSLLAARLGQTVDDLRLGAVPGSPGDSSPAAAQVDSLRASLLLIQ